MGGKSSNKSGTLAILIASICFAVVFAQTPWSRLLENEQLAAIAQVGQRDTSGQVHLVEIDAKSLVKVQRWPWPRDHYARLIRQLDEAGARSIVFDIDFSSASSAAEDAELAEAIAGARASVVMPTFSQAASEGSGRRLDALPIPAFRQHTTLASASVLADADARVRRMVYGTKTDGLPRPSLSAQIAGAAGAIDTSFAIDYSLDPFSIPRYSFVEIEEGSFDAASIAGKDVLVGATAVELGDRYGVPIHGVIPGVTIQALAAETLLAGGVLELGWLPMLLMAVFFALCIVLARSYRSTILRVFLALTTIVAIETIALHLSMTVLEVIPAAILVVCAGVGQAARIARRELREKSLVDSETGLPNAQAFAQDEHPETQFVAAVFIKDFDSIQAVIGKENTGKFVERVLDRMSSAHALGQAYRADTRVLAWVHDGDYQQLLDAFETILEAIRKPIEVAGRRIDVAVSFGVASGGALAAASRAASFAAHDGLRWHAHEDAEAAIIEQRVSLMGELDEAIDANQLDVLYQPKLKLANDRIESVEALVRWEHPTRGYLGPDVFIPLAEETNRIEALTLFVLKRVIADLQEWCRSKIVVTAAVNISASLISSEPFVRAVEGILNESGVPRKRLIFEVTESATMRDPDVAARNLSRFRDLGVKISMDDYGTGQSTLSYLQKLPLSELKIDRAFVQNAHRDRSDALLVRSTIQLAHSLDLQVVCEGVEEQACLDFLEEIGCDYAQGYYISRPVSASDLSPQLPRSLERVS